MCDVISVAQKLASLVQSMVNCDQSGNDEWYWKHRELARSIVGHQLPSGSGLDCDVILSDGSSGERLKLDVGYHHMDQYGGYSKWTYHTIVVTGSLQSGHNVRVTGRDHNGIKEYLEELFDAALREPFNAEAYPETAGRGE